MLELHAASTSLLADHGHPYVTHFAVPVLYVDQLIIEGLAHHGHETLWVIFFIRSIHHHREWPWLATLDQLAQVHSWW